MPGAFFCCGCAASSLTYLLPAASEHPLQKDIQGPGRFLCCGCASSLTHSLPAARSTHSKTAPTQKQKKHGLTKLSLAQSRSRCMRNDLPTRDAGPGSPELCKSGGMPTLGSLLGLNPNILSYQGMLRARGFKLGTDRVWGWRMLAYAWNIKRCPRTNHDS